MDEIEYYKGVKLHPGCNIIDGAIIMYDPPFNPSESLLSKLSKLSVKKMAKLKNIELVNEMIAKGYINVQKHPDYDLYIYNYSKSAGFDHMWNEATNQCRGIICDGKGNIVARPFEKFFNYEEIQDKSTIPNLHFEVYEKLDGSLGILYFADGLPFIATRGSFVGDQAEHATKILYKKYANVIPELDQTKTYLFEIIYKENSTNLVVDYGDTDDIFLIAVIDTATGEEFDTYDYKDMFKVATRYDGITNYLAVREMFSGENKEGFVIKFANNFRMKVKFEEYFRLHALMCGLSDKSIFMNLREGTLDNIKDAIGEFSEEKQIYFNEIVKKYTDWFNSIVDVCKSEFRNDFESRKEAAAYYTTCTYPGIMFKMFDGKDYSQNVWAIIAKNRTTVNDENEEE